jgi:hypothetical protein
VYLAICTALTATVTANARVPATSDMLVDLGIT